MKREIKKLFKKYTNIVITNIVMISLFIIAEVKEVDQ
jgi:hypothetical protein